MKSNNDYSYYKNSGASTTGYNVVQKIQEARKTLTDNFNKRNIPMISRNKIGEGGGGTTFRDHATTTLEAIKERGRIRAIHENYQT